MSGNAESSITGWMKVLIPIIVAACISLTGVFVSQSSKVASMETTLNNRTATIADLKSKDAELDSDINALKAELNEIRLEIRATSGSQERVLELVDRLSTTLVKLEVAMGKLETKLEYNSKEPR